MPADAGVSPDGSATRLIAMGSAELTLGFRLIGFETVADADADDVERVLQELILRKEKAGDLYMVCP